MTEILIWVGIYLVVGLLLTALIMACELYLLYKNEGDRTEASLEIQVREILFGEIWFNVIIWPIITPFWIIASIIETYKDLNINMSRAIAKRIKSKYKKKNPQEYI